MCPENMCPESLHTTRYYACRFGLVPIITRWAWQPANDWVMNELGFAFLQRMTINPLAPLANDPNISQVDHVNVMHEVDGAVIFWSLLNPQHGANDSTLLPTAQG